MSDELKDAFVEYAELVIERLKPAKGEFPRIRPLRELAYSQERRRLEECSLFEVLEDSEEFKKLLARGRETLLADYSSLRWRDPDVYVFKSRVRTFFRRSGFYRHARNEPKQDLDELFESFIAAFKDKNQSLRFILPINGISFVNEPRFQASDFCIRRFSARELKDIFNIETNISFYPESIPPTSWLRHYSCIDVTIRTSLTGTRYEASLPDLPWAVLRNLGILLVWDWSRLERPIWPLGKPWHPFEIPCSFCLPSSLIVSPCRAPSVPRVGLWSDFDSEWEESPEDEWPMDFSVPECEFIDALVPFVDGVSEFFRRSQRYANDRSFIEIAMKYLVKAFFAPERDELLWLIAALEALVGGAKQGITKQLSIRVATIVGTDESQRKTVKEIFGKLYDLRSKLV